MSNKREYFISKSNRNTSIEELIDEAISNIEQLNMGDGSALIPSYGFTNSPSTGIYLSGTPAHHISFSSLGAERFRIADTHITALEPIRLSATDSPALTFSGDLDTGLKWNGDGEMMFISNGLNKLQVSSPFVSVYDAPLFIYSNTSGVGQKITFYGYNVSQIQVGTDILQRCAVGNTALEFTPTTVGLGSTDIIYRWKTGGSNLMEFSNRSQLLQTSGSSSVPAYSFQASGNAGMYYASGLKFSHGSTERLTISDSGVKVGTGGTNFRHVLYGTSTVVAPNLASGSNAVFGPISFGFSFSSTPVVLISALPSNPPINWLDHCIVMLQSIAVNQFYVQIANKGSGTTTGNMIIQWQAIGN